MSWFANSNQETLEVSKNKMYPVHGEVDPQGVVQLIQQFDKPLLLRGKYTKTEQTSQKQAAPDRLLHLTTQI